MNAPSEAKVLSWNLTQAGEETRVELVGELSERSGLEQLAAELPRSALSFDLGGVRRVNSLGVREWVRFLSGVRAEGRGLAFERCSVAVVAQLNMVASFSAGAEVRSVFAPYLCPECNEEAQQLFDVAELDAERIEAPWPCPGCGEALEFDDLAEHFLSFTRAATG